MNQQNSNGSFQILSINISSEKGVQKVPVDHAVLEEDHGIVGDAHAGPWHRQVSLLSDEDVDTMRNKGATIRYGAFAENITTKGAPIGELPLGTVLQIGIAELVITQRGKECHHGCEIFKIVGDCVMPRRGVFARVIRGGEISRESECHYRVG